TKSQSLVSCCSTWAAVRHRTALSRRSKFGPQQLRRRPTSPLFLAGVLIPIFRGRQSGEVSMFLSKRRATSWGLALAFLGALSFVATAADARVGGGGSFGSRGSRTYSSPPGTNTAPSVVPVEKSFTQPTKPTTAQPPLSSASRFGGWRSILLGGLFAG